MRTLPLVLAMAVLGMACREDETPPQPQLSDIKHVLLPEAAPFYYLKNFEIDFDQDSLADFAFSVGLEYAEGAEHTKFMAHSLRDGKMLLLQSAAIAHMTDREIGPAVDFDAVQWDIQSGELLVKTRLETNEIQWTGSWLTNPEGIWR